MHELSALGRPGPRRSFLRIDYRTDRPVLIKAKQGEVPAHTHRAGTELFPKFVGPGVRAQAWFLFEGYRYEPG